MSIMVLVTSFIDHATIARRPASQKLASAASSRQMARRNTRV
jgi:hypothetical protein